MECSVLHLSMTHPGFGGARNTEKQLPTFLRLCQWVRHVNAGATQPKTLCGIHKRVVGRHPRIKSVVGRQARRTVFKYADLHILLYKSFSVSVADRDIPGLKYYRITRVEVVPGVVFACTQIVQNVKI